MRDEAPDQRSEHVEPPLRLFERLAVRWPRTSVLRLHWVLGWTVTANLVAWRAAGWFIGSLTEVRDSVIYMMLWLLLALIAAVAWAILQHRERSRLPRCRSLTMAWSPGMGSVLVALVLSPAWTSVSVGDARLRSLRTKEQLTSDMNALGIKLDKNGPPPYRFGSGERPKRIAPTPPGKAVQSPSSGPYRVDPRSYAKPGKPVNPGPPQPELDTLLVYVTRDAMRDARACTENTEECTDAWEAVRLAARDNLTTVARAHALPPWGLPPFSEDRLGMIAVMAIAVVLGSMTGYLGVLRFRVILLTVAGLALPVLTAQPCTLLALYAFHISDANLARRWFGLSWSLCVVVAIGLAVSLYRKRERSAAHDVGLVLGLLLPFAAVGTQYGSNLSQRYVNGEWQPYLFIDRFYLYVAGTCAAVTVVGFAMALLLSWYRALPRAA
jgi:hypothetical protein